MQEAVTKRAVKPAVARSPAEVAKGLEQAWENFRKDYPDIPEAEARKMWEEAGG